MEIRSSNPEHRASVRYPSSGTVEVIPRCSEEIKDVRISDTSALSRRRSGVSTGSAAY
jgi:hypothetical protein